MKTSMLLYLLFFLVPTSGIAQSIYTSRAVELSFFSEARFENIEAVSKKGSSAINLHTRELAFKVPIQSFVFDKGLMQEHFNENYMESDKYPHATFKGKINEAVDLQKTGSYQVTATGTLNLHGVSKERTVSGVIVVKEGQLLLNAAFIIPVSDHRIDIPNDKLLNISQNISVKVKAVYEPKP